MVQENFNIERFNSTGTTSLVVYNLHYHESQNIDLMPHFIMKVSRYWWTSNIIKNWSLTYVT